MAASIFAYGTLEIPAVMRAVTGRTFPSRSGVLRGFARFLVRERPYPGIVEAKGEETDGTLYESVDPRSVALLDLFEGSLYERWQVTVAVPGIGPLPAETYVVPARLRDALSGEPWNRPRFIAEHLGPYLEACRAFRASEAARVARQPASRS